MKIKIFNRNIPLRKLVCLALYYSFLRYLPSSGNPVIGKLSKQLRYACCKNIFKKCGKNVNIERKAFFGSGLDLCIGDNSGLGNNCIIPGSITIGNDVMMEPNRYILGLNHSYKRVDIPMRLQGDSTRMETIIEDDVWIGLNVVITPGRSVRKGSIIAAGCVLSKDFPEYSVIGGNPSRLIKSRKADN